MAGARIIEWVADLFAKALFKDTARDVLKDGTEKVAKGAIDESEKAFNPAERRLAGLLASEGKDVKAVRESDVPGVRTADSLVDGQPAEFKSLDSGATNGSVKNALNSAQGQADRAYIDARGSGLSESEAMRGLRRYLGASPDRMKFIRIIGDGFNITWP